MSYTITLVFPDCDSTDTAELYLTGEPVPCAWPITPDCGLCDNSIDGFESLEGEQLYGDFLNGDHRGVIEVQGIQNHEFMHLRCAMDCVNMGSLGIITQNAEIESGGRHLKSA